MEIVFTVAQFLIVALAIVLFFAGLASVVGALTSYETSQRQITERANSEIEQIASEGRERWMS